MNDFSHLSCPLYERKLIKFIDLKTEGNILDNLNKFQEIIKFNSKLQSSQSKLRRNWKKKYYFMRMLNYTGVEKTVFLRECKKLFLLTKNEDEKSIPIIFNASFENKFGLEIWEKNGVSFQIDSESAFSRRILCSILNVSFSYLNKYYKNDYKFKKLSIKEVIDVFRERCKLIEKYKDLTFNILIISYGFDKIYEIDKNKDNMVLNQIEKYIYNNVLSNEVLDKVKITISCLIIETIDTYNIKINYKKLNYYSFNFEIFNFENIENILKSIKNDYFPNQIFSLNESIRRFWLLNGILPSVLNSMICYFINIFKERENKKILEKLKNDINNKELQGFVNNKIKLGFMTNKFYNHQIHYYYYKGLDHSRIVYNILLGGRSSQELNEKELEIIQLFVKNGIILKDKNLKYYMIDSNFIKLIENFNSKLSNKLKSENIDNKEIKIIIANIILERMKSEKLITLSEIFRIKINKKINFKFTHKKNDSKVIKQRIKIVNNNNYNIIGSFDLNEMKYNRNKIIDNIYITDDDCDLFDCIVQDNKFRLWIQIINFENQINNNSNKLLLDKEYEDINSLYIKFKEFLEYNRDNYNLKDITKNKNVKNIYVLVINKKLSENLISNLKDFHDMILITIDRLKNIMGWNIYNRIKLIYSYSNNIENYNLNKNFIFKEIKHNQENKKRKNESFIQKRKKRKKEI